MSRRKEERQGRKEGRKEGWVRAADCLTSVHQLPSTRKGARHYALSKAKVLISRSGGNYDNLVDK